jgi:hypothetical protein
MSSDDTHVRRAWYPLEETLLLRWCVGSDPDDFGLAPGEPAGDLDLTGSADLVWEIAAHIPGATISSASTFFDASWAG